MLMMIVIAVLLSLFLYQKTSTGKIIDETSLPNIPMCSDTDKGFFSKERGIVMRTNFLGITSSYRDACSTKTGEENILIEQYCEAGRVKSEKVPCETCERGSCHDSLLDEGCYVSLTINEEGSDQDITFTLSEVKNIYGPYTSVVKKDTSAGTYLLKSKDSEGHLIESYPLTSSRFIISEDFSKETPEGETLQAQSGVIKVIIPYDSRIKKLIVDAYGEENDLHLDPTLLSCSRTCKIAEQILSLRNEECCNGLIPMEQADGSFVCSDCGDSICSSSENTYTCAIDCKQRT